MAKLIYTAIGSLDGYFEDEEGRFDWAEPDDEVHAFVNDLDRRWGMSQVTNSFPDSSRSTSAAHSTSQPFKIEREP